MAPARQPAGRLHVQLFMSSLQQTKTLDTDPGRVSYRWDQKFTKACHVKKHVIYENIFLVYDYHQGNIYRVDPEDNGVHDIILVEESYSLERLRTMTLALGGIVPSRRRQAFGRLPPFVETIRAQGSCRGPQ